MVSLPTKDAHVNGTFPILLTLGTAASLAWVAWGRAEREAIPRVDAALAALIGGLCGARLGFVLAHLSYFVSRPIEALWFWQGGLSGSAGVLGASVGLLMYARSRRRPFWPLADAMAVPTAILTLVSWVGCLLDGCAYGRRASPGPLTTPSMDIFGWWGPRWPTQAVGVVASALILMLAVWLEGQRLAAGLAAAMVLASVSALALALAFTRADPAPVLLGTRTDALGPAAILILSLGAAALRTRRLT